MSYLLVCFFLIIDMSCNVTSKFTNLKDVKYYEIVEIRHVDIYGRNKRDLSTFNHVHRKHLEETRYTFYGHNRYFHLQIYKNRFLIPNTFVNIYQNADGSYRYDKHSDHCYYHGYLANRKKSFAAVSTCYGLKGVIRDEDNEEFHIEPHLFNNKNNDNGLNPLNNKYILFKSKDLIENVDAVCGVNDANYSINGMYYQNESNSFRVLQSISEHHRLRRSVIDMKYVEVIVVLDNLKFKEHGESINATRHRGFEIFNMVDHIYKTMNIRVAIVNMIIWNRYNMATVSKNAGETLNSLERYTREVLHGEMKLTFDNAQLISTQSWGSLVGLAGVGNICTPASSAINRDHNPNAAITANTVAHEIGHNIGFMHNTKTCKCRKKPCVMSSNVPSKQCQSFTDCAEKEYVKRLARGDLPCLLDFPGKLFGKPKCGNGYVEKGEECDCGTEVECKRLNSDTCCNFATCKLQKQAECATGVCCEKCMFKRRGVLCRKSINEDCDLEEFCTGKSGNCPKNFHLQDGTPCKNDTAYCYQGACKTHDTQCEMLWGINAVKANDVCFQVNAREGTAWGNCGKNLRDDYVRCMKKDTLCGKLQCTARRPDKPLPKFPIIGWDRQRSTVTFRRGNKAIICILGKTTVSHDLQDPTMTDDGVKCGNNSICIDHKCTHVSSLSHIKTCSKQCLNAGGVCNSNGNCHCPKGYACPYCELAGPGGSADSGQGCILDDNCKDCFTSLMKAMLVLFLLVIPLIILVSFLSYRYRNWIRDKCSSHVYTRNETTRTERNIDKELNSDFQGHSLPSIGHPYIDRPDTEPSSFRTNIPPPLPSRPPDLEFLNTF